MAAQKNGVGLWWANPRWARILAITTSQYSSPTPSLLLNEFGQRRKPAPRRAGKTPQGQTRFLGRFGRGATGKRHRRLCAVGRPILSEDHVPPAKSIQKQNYWGVGFGLGITHLAKMRAGAKASGTFLCVRRPSKSPNPFWANWQRKGLLLARAVAGGSGKVEIEQKVHYSCLTPSFACLTPFY